MWARPLWWRDLLFVFGTIDMALCGLWLSNSRDSRVRSHVTATLAALTLGVVPALIGFLALTFVGSVLKVSTGSATSLGYFGLVLVIGLAAAALWQAAQRRERLKQGTEWVSTRVSSYVAAIMRRIGRSTATAKVSRPSAQARLGDYLAGDTPLPVTPVWLAIATLGFAVPALFGFIATAIRAVARVGVTLVLVLACIVVPVGSVIGAGYLIWKRNQAKR